MNQMKGSVEPEMKLALTVNMEWIKIKKLQNFAECFEYLTRIKEMNQDKYSVEELPKVLKLCAESNVFPL